MLCPHLHQLPGPPPGKSGWPWTSESKTLPPVMPNGQPWPKLAIVTPSYNQAEFLEATIRSVLLQGYPNLEYIIIDGGSRDGSCEIINKYQPWLTYWESEPDRGQYHAVNKGFAHSAGQVMAWLNSDDMLTPGTFEIIGSIFGNLAGRVKWVTGLSAHWNRHDNLVRIFGHPGHSNQLVRWGYYDSRGFGTIQQEGTFWSRDLWLQAGGGLREDLRFAADFELWRAFAHYATLHFVPVVLAGYRVHSNQKTTSMQPYLAEIDALLAARWSTRLVNRWLKNTPGRYLLRLYRVIKQDFRVLSYNYPQNCWEIL